MALILFREALTITQVVGSIIIILSAIISPTMIWDAVDIGAALMAIINVYAIFALRKVMIDEYYQNK